MSANLIVNEAKVGIGQSEKLNSLTVKELPIFTLTGTVDKSNGSTTLSGTGTKFLSELGLGDLLDIPGPGIDDVDFKYVVEIVSDDELILNSAPGISATDQQATCRPAMARFERGEGGDNPGQTTISIDYRGRIGMGVGPTTVMPNYDYEAILIVNQPDNGLSALVLGNAHEGENDGGVILNVDASDDGTRELQFKSLDSTEAGRNLLGVGSVLGVKFPMGVMFSPITIDANRTLSEIECLVLADAGSGGIELTLPPMGDYHDGRAYYIYKTAGAGDVTVTPDGTETINGVNASKTISTQWAGIVLYATQAGGGWVASVLTPA